MFSTLNTTIHVFKFKRIQDLKKLLTHFKPKRVQNFKAKYLRIFFWQIELYSPKPSILKPYIGPITICLTTYIQALRRRPMHTPASQ